jgi:hypothetical protein
MGRLASPTEEGDIWLDEEPTPWVTRERSAPKDPFAVGPLPSWVRARQRPPSKRGSALRGAASNPL